MIRVSTKKPGPRSAPAHNPRMWARLFAAAAVACAPAAVRSQAASENPGELLKAANAFSQQAEFSRAIPLLRKILETEPQNAAANAMLGVDLLDTGHPEEAIAPLRIALAADPANEATAGYLGDAEMESKDFASSAETFQRLVLRSNGSERSLTWWTGFSLERYRELEFSLRATAPGRAALLTSAAYGIQGDAASRSSLLTQALALNPRDGIAWGELGITQIQLAKKPEAESSLKSALQYAPEAASTLELECLIDAAHHDWPEAEARIKDLRERSEVEFKKLVKAWPKEMVPPRDAQSPVWDCLGGNPASCMEETGNAQQQAVDSPEALFARGEWERLTRLPPPAREETAHWLARGVAFSETGDCPRAIPALERGLKSGAESAGALLVSCYESEAIHAADRLKAQGNEAAVHKIRGDILLSIRLDAAKATSEYKAALNLKPNDPETLEKLSEAYFSEGDLNGARQAAETALTQSPHRAQLFQLLIRIAMSERDYARALSLIDRLEKITQDNPWAQVQAATAYSQTEHPSEAAQQLSAALNAGYPDPKGALHALLAVELRKLGRNEEAHLASAAAIKLADAYQRQQQTGEDYPP